MIETILALGAALAAALAALVKTRDAKKQAQRALEAEKAARDAETKINKEAPRDAVDADADFWD